MLMSESRLDAFRREVNWQLACGALAEVDLEVTNDDGEFPVIVALSEERWSTVLGRIRAVGGYANLFVEAEGGKVWAASVIGTACAIGEPEPDDILTGDDAPGADATVGMFLEYVVRRPHGVQVSAAMGHPACARDARTVDFAAS
ncbi:hypothetical protein A5699_04660 [Mycobacterium sp. E802]|nr:hypothetical protein A5699_04660 [Mycobacterium sp. E802]